MLDIFLSEPASAQGTPLFGSLESASLRSSGGARLHLGTKTFAPQKTNLFIPPIASREPKSFVIGD